ncbi:hypothetical protein EW146_g1714 [Bondarzewia mesenterica]|uniref:alanine--glyoxylate transaminase n=1 Tax=Bondarzewia mesenterica TaxID=1095465 RepID=A0A4S4M4Q9_9AGAM|nr:hypothetical protein EW146_g1714 [Bondarzewia mesenterica]
MSAEFVPIFGDSIRMTRDVVYTKTAQPFLISGSGTLGWDQVSANLVEFGENALVLNTGYFGQSFADCLQTYGANVDQIKADFGATVSLEKVEQALRSKKYKIVTVTHVDTSTAVLSNPKAVAEVVKKVSPDTLVVLDAVCAVASEEIRMDDWGIDVVMSASQKGLGAPPGLSVVLVSQKALKVVETRSTPIPSYYASWRRWLPIMSAYEKGSAAYFATPPVNLIYAFHQSLVQIVKGSPSLEERLKLHIDASARVKAAGKELGLKQVAVDSSEAANGMTALWCPPGVKASQLMPLFLKKDVVVAGGLGAEKGRSSSCRPTLPSARTDPTQLNPRHPPDNYFRIGHMGTTVANTERGDIDRIIAVLREVIAEATSLDGTSDALQSRL